MTGNRGDDYGIGLCHTCVKALVAFDAQPSPPGARPAPRFAVTWAAALVNIPGPDGDVIYQMAVPLPSCFEHLEINKPKPPPNGVPAARQSRLITP